MTVAAAAVVGVGSVASGVMASRSAKKSTAAANRIQDRQLGMMERQMSELRGLVANLPEQSRQMMEDLSKAYAEINLLLTNAKNQADEKSAELFQREREVIKSHMSAELEAIGQQSGRIFGVIDELSDNAINLINEDADANEALQENYKKETKNAIGTLRKMSEASSERVNAIIETGLPPEAAASLSRTRDNLEELTRKTRALEARKSIGGAASRTTATEIEAIKALGETTATLRESAQEDLVRQGDIQARAMDAEATRMSNLERTRGRETLAATQPFDQARIGVATSEADKTLSTIGNANTEIRKSLKEEGEGNLQREEQFTRDSMSLISGKAAGTQAIKEREQDLTFQGTGAQTGMVNSMSDVLSVMSQNYNNMAEKSRAQSRDAFSTAAKGVVGGFAGGGFKDGKFNADAFGKGFARGAFNIDFTPKTTKVTE